MKRTPLRRAPTARHRQANQRLRTAWQTVHDRSAGRCECCGQPLTAVQFHHRDARGMGGSTRNPRHWDPRNLLALLPAHHQRIELSTGIQRQNAYDRGLLVRMGSDYTTTPLLLHGHTSVQLTEEGGYELHHHRNAP